MIYGLLFVPIITAILCYFLKNKRLVELVSSIGAGIEFLMIILTSIEVFTIGPIEEEIWYLDGLSMYILIIIGLISLLAALYSISYMDHELHEKIIDFKKLRQYYLLFHIFLETMVLVCISNNLGMMWIAIEGTTLASAFLVGFYDKKTSVEAAWKYIIICSVGITLALLGTIFIYTSSVAVLGESENALNWTYILANASGMDPTPLKIAFIFIFIGYGTKVGLAPMHTWLPDAHSQAPTPISALLSGVLLNVAMYGLLRYHIIVMDVIGPGFSDVLLLVFGLFSLLIAAVFIIVSKDYKRLFAYSSIEHMGIVSIGIGIGGPIGILGGIFHIFNHALTKPFLFFGAGNILLKYKTRNMEYIKGIIQVMPWTGVLFMIGMFALTGNPPFSLFASELTIINAIISQNNYLVAGIFVFALVMIFAAFLHHISAMVFGKQDDKSENEHLEEIRKGEISKINIVVMIILLIIITYIGIYIPSWFNSILTNIVGIF
jgi:hydrogenase-4 component F